MFELCGDKFDSCDETLTGERRQLRIGLQRHRTIRPRTPKCRREPPRGMRTPGSTRRRTA
jgi:hypothetical protein